MNVLQQVSLERALDLANALGIHSFRSIESYGLALTLGGGEVRLIELAGAYAALANDGVRVDPYAVNRISNVNGETLYFHSSSEQAPVVLDPRIAWLISDILSDNAARASTFGQNSVLRLSRPSAAKTGTTTDWRDNWTLGYTPDLVTGVWVGNADNEPMVQVSGISGAGPIWHDFMEVALRGMPSTWFDRPPGLVQVMVCALSGMLPTPLCPHTRAEWFIEGTQPTEPDNWYQVQSFDTATGKLATATTPPSNTTQRIVLDLPSIVREWARGEGWPLYVDDGSTANQADGELPVILVQPDPGSIYRMSGQLPTSIQRIPIEVRVHDPLIDKVEVVINDSAVIASFSHSPYTSYWQLQPGDHHFVARAYYRNGTVLDSPQVTIQVLE